MMMRKESWNGTYGAYNGCIYYMNKFYAHKFIHAATDIQLINLD